jgi:tetratricopeptide (TPR) repeat protein
LAEVFRPCAGFSGFLREATCERAAAAPIIQKFPKEHQVVRREDWVSGERRGLRPDGVISFQFIWLQRGEKGMNATRRMASLAVLAALCLLGVTMAPAMAQDTGAAAAQPKYTMAEYNSYQACAAEKNPQAQIKCLDDFVAKYPSSALLNYIYPLYYKNYGGQKNFPKTLEYCDKLIAMGDKANVTEKYEAYSVRAYAYNNIQSPDAATANSAHDAALAGAKIVDSVPKPAGADDVTFEQQKKQSTIFFYGTAANAALAAKNCTGAVEAYKLVLAITPDDLTANFNLGKAYSCTTPPQQFDAIWSYARAASSKNANEKQSKSVKDYLRKLVVNFQGGTVCDSLTDAQMNELLQLAASSVDRPASYKLISSADLDTARANMTIASVFTDLKAGGDKAKLTWTAACGLEFPDVPGKAIEVAGGADPVVIKTAFVTTDAEFQAATTADMEFKIPGQPEAGKINPKSDSPPFVHITGTLTSYDPDPAFMIHLEKGKVNADDLPKEKAPVKKPVRKPAAKPQ